MRLTDCGVIPIDCAARNEGRVCLSCEAWEAGVRAGQTVLLEMSMPDLDSLDDETEREILSDFFESLGGRARVVFRSGWRGRRRAMSATYAETRDGQVFVYVRGRLVHKRWPTLGYSMTFDAVGAPRVHRHGEP